MAQYREVNAVEAALWGFLGTLVGAAASIATSWLQNHHEIKRQEAGDSLQRIERARAFQRNNLLELQQALLDAVRLFSRAHLEDQRAFRESGEWAKARLPEDVSEGSRETTAKLVALTERVADDALRDSLETFRLKMTSCDFPRRREHAEATFADLSGSYPLLMKHLGQVLRNLY